jgi:hypothetical protein
VGRRIRADVRWRLAETPRTYEPTRRGVSQPEYIMFFVMVYLPSSERSNTCPTCADTLPVLLKITVSFLRPRRMRDGYGLRCP